MTDTQYAELAPLMEAYGAACYAAQSLEASLRLLLILNKSASENQLLSSDAAEHIESETASVSLMQLFRKAKKKEYFSNHDYRIVKSAVISRNLLIHKYWGRNVSKTLTPEGRDTIRREIDKLKVQIISADQIILTLIDRYLTEHGISTDALAQKAAELYDMGDGELSDDLDQEHPDA